MKNVIREAIQGAGGPARVAQEMHVSVQAVCFWRDRKRQLPAEVCPVLERLNEGRFLCEDLRPDVDWGYLRGTSSQRPTQVFLPDEGGKLDA